MKTVVVITAELLTNVIVTIFGLTTTTTTTTILSGNNETWNEESEYLSTTTTKISNNCEMYKTQCHNDTDCYHRLFYVHSTCILNGLCKPQCKTAILRLYESEHGRRLLHSDLSCLQAVKSDLVDCQLSPEAETVHCTLARQMCHANVECHRNLNLYENQCESKLLNVHKCPPNCIERLVDVFKTAEGAKLAHCRCWVDEDALCEHRKVHVLDPCNQLALDALLNNNNNNNNNIDKSGELEQIVLNVVDHNDDRDGGGGGGSQHRPVTADKSTDRRVKQQRINGCSSLCFTTWLFQSILFILCYTFSF